MPRDAPRRTVRGPFLFLDFGGTLLDLRGLPAAMASVLQVEVGRGTPGLPDLAAGWAVRTEDLLPAAQGAAFAPEKEIAARALQEVLEARGLGVGMDSARRLVREAWARFAAEAVLQADATPQFLASLRDRAAAVAIVSDGDTDAVRGLLDRLGIASSFDSVVTSEDVRAYKPHPAIYRAALDAVGAVPARSLFVSDSPRDLVGALDVGMGAVLVPRPSPRPAAAPPRSSFVLRTLADLTEVLGSLRGPGSRARR